MDVIKCDEFLNVGLVSCLCCFLQLIQHLHVCSSYVKEGRSTGINGRGRLYTIYAAIGMEGRVPAEQHREVNKRDTD